MKQSDVGRKVKIFDRRDGRGILGVITQVYDDGYTFRMKTDNQREYEFTTSGEMAVQVQFIRVGDF